MKFYGTISVGSSAKKFKVLFDTGSGDMWLPSEDTYVCGSKQCYSSQKSTSSTPDGREFSADYLSGSVAGVFVKDTVRLGSFSTEQIFAKVSYFSGLDNVYPNSKWDGMVGMAWPSLSKYKFRPTIFSLFDANTNLAKQFAFYLPKNPKKDGELVIGGYNKKRFTGDLVPVKVTSQAYWTVGITSVIIGNTVVSNKVTGILDTCTSLIMLPKNAFDKIVQNTGAVMNGERYTVDCDMVSLLPKLEMEIGGTKWIFTGEDYIIRYINKACILGMLPKDSKVVDNQNWIIGEVFFRHVYTVFDVDQSTVSFAYVK
ncbi:unnamed protein product [Phytomonas sp. Hart1]|nr:unnamed protein product [Phytomonas sp. Hart1]|eukprot:CCW66039.1 unnamed protein product [Phytomonas sp. isolate Hart1]